MKVVMAFEAFLWKMKRKTVSLWGRRTRKNPQKNKQKRIVLNSELLSNVGQLSQ
jgi:hypothetical protein